MATPAEASGVAETSPAAQGTRAWPMPIARAVVFAVAALIITFSADHSARLGLLVFGGFALVAGVVVAALGQKFLDDSTTRRLFLAQGALTVVAGVVSLVLSFAGADAGIYLLVVGVWAAIAGLLELYAGFRMKARSPLARDWLIVGALTAVLAIVFVVIPPDFVQPFGGIQKIKGELTASVVAVGLFGAYAAIAAVFLVIAGLSLKWQTSQAAEVRP